MNQLKTSGVPHLVAFILVCDKARDSEAGLHLARVGENYERATNWFLIRTSAS